MGIKIETVKIKGVTFLQETNPSDSFTPLIGDTWIIPSNGFMFVWLNGDWFQPSGESVDSGIPPPGNRGVFGGGYGETNTIDYIDISTPANAQDFGDLTVSRFYLTATSNGINNRGVFGGGKDGNYDRVNTIDYIDISPKSDAQDFGDLTVNRDSLAATSNGTNNRGVFGGGKNGSGNNSNVIDYIDISTKSNAQNFSDLTGDRNVLSSTSNGTNNRGIFGGGNDGSDNTSLIDYIDISTPGNAQDFGDLIMSRSVLSATSNGTNNRGVFGGGYNSGYKNTIDYIDISTPANAQDFGDLTEDRSELTATSNGTNNRGVFGGGWDENDNSNVIDYIDISSKSDAQDFGDLTMSRSVLSATSNGLT